MRAVDRAIVVVGIVVGLVGLIGLVLVGALFVKSLTPVPAARGFDQFLSAYGVEIARTGIAASLLWLVLAAIHLTRRSPGRGYLRSGLHWSWRAAVAIGVGAASFCALLAIQTPTFFRIHESVLFLSATVTSIAVVITYGLLTHYLSPTAAAERETRCRQCRYILRGITEPRCPECGERI